MRTGTERSLPSSRRSDGDDSFRRSSRTRPGGRTRTAPGVPATAEGRRVTRTRASPLAARVRRTALPQDGAAAGDGALAAPEERRPRRPAATATWAKVTKGAFTGEEYDQTQPPASTSWIPGGSAVCGENGSIHLVDQRQ